MFYAIGNSSPNVVFICLTVLAIIILLFWLSPTITELMFSSKDTKLKLKQKGSA